MNTFQKLKAANRKRSPEFGNTIEEWTLPEWGNALAGETGELCNIIKKVHRGDFNIDNASTKQMLADEAADVAIYLDLLCQRAGIDLENAIVNKFNYTSAKIHSEVRIEHAEAEMTI
jgi:NTP pyrophosphatase (non-canonical NTP hydrolase)